MASMNRTSKKFANPFPHINNKLKLRRLYLAKNVPSILRNLCTIGAEQSFQLYVLKVEELNGCFDFTLYAFVVPCYGINQ